MRQIAFLGLLICSCGVENGGPETVDQIGVGPTDDDTDVVVDVEFGDRGVIALSSRYAASGVFLNVPYLCAKESAYAADGTTVIQKPVVYSYSSTTQTLLHDLYGTETPAADMDIVACAPTSARLFIGGISDHESVKGFLYSIDGSGTATPTDIASMGGLGDVSSVDALWTVGDEEVMALGDDSSTLIAADSEAKASSGFTAVDVSSRQYVVFPDGRSLLDGYESFAADGETKTTIAEEVFLDGYPLANQGNTASTSGTSLAISYLEEKTAKVMQIDAVSVAPESAFGTSGVATSPAEMTGTVVPIALRFYSSAIWQFVMETDGDTVSLWVTKFGTDGKPDEGFGEAGAKEITVAGIDNFYSIEPMPTGWILFGAATASSTEYAIALDEDFAVAGSGELP